MKRLSMMLIFLSACLMVNAQNLYLFVGQRMDYKLRLKTVGKIYGLFGSYSGEANFSVISGSQNNYTVYLSAYVYHDKDKPTFWINNRAEIYYGHNQVKEVIYQLSDSTTQRWEVSNPEGLIFHFFNEQIIDTLITNSYQAQDAISATLFLIDLSRVSLGKIFTTYYFTHDSTDRSRWEMLQAKIEPAIKQLKISGDKIDCYQYTLKTQNKINLGGKYTLGEPVIWVACNSGKPVKVKVTLYWKFFPVAIVIGELK